MFADNHHGHVWLSGKVEPFGHVMASSLGSSKKGGELEMCSVPSTEVRQPDQHKNLEA